MVRRCKVHGFYDAQHAECPTCHVRSRYVPDDHEDNFTLPAIIATEIAADTTWSVPDFSSSVPDSPSVDFGGGGGFSGGGGGSDF